MNIDFEASTLGSPSTLQRESEDPGWPSVTVIVPVRNGAAELVHCLSALAAQDYPGVVQVVIADNASADGPEAVVECYPGVHLVREARPGSYAARNTALTAATGEVIAFTDADCRPNPGWLREAVTALRLPPAAAMVGGRVSISYQNGAPQTGSELYESVHGFPQERYLSDQHFAVTANMVTWRWVLEKVGHFDASLMSRGDAQWGQRVHAAGMLQRYAPEAVVLHPARTTLRESVTKWRRVAGGKVANDLAAGRGPKHFAGLVAYQLKTSWSTVRSGGAALGPAPLVQRTQYVLMASLCRAVTTLEYSRGLIRSARGSVVPT